MGQFLQVRSIFGVRPVTELRLVYNSCTSTILFIYFGLSLYFPGGQDTALHVATLRTFPTIPELSQTVPYNPFKVDIFQLGLTMQKLIDVRPSVSVSDTAYPGDRPNPADALQHLRNIATTITPSKLSEQIWEKDTGLWKKVSRTVLGCYRYDSDFRAD
ncbi:hypothetical protein FB451DRAFT_1171949 [Mycena latifolia]|nr:hypothetical protein FB451DRAFT_1171949 [Mycena latifolia]